MKKPHSHSSPLPLLACIQGARESGTDVIEMNHSPQCRISVLRPLEVHECAAGSVFYIFRPRYDKYPRNVQVIFRAVHHGYDVTTYLLCSEHVIIWRNLLFENWLIPHLILCFSTVFFGLFADPQTVHQRLTVALPRLMNVIFFTLSKHPNGVFMHWNASWPKKCSECNGLGTHILTASA